MVGRPSNAEVVERRRRFVIIDPMTADAVTEEEDEGGWRGMGDFFMREERELSHIVRYARVVFVCGVFLQLLA